MRGGTCWGGMGWGGGREGAGGRRAGAERDAGWQPYIFIKKKRMRERSMIKFDVSEFQPLVLAR
jgi:hypothetical protein